MLTLDIKDEPNGDIVLSLKRITHTSHNRHRTGYSIMIYNSCACVRWFGSYINFASFIMQCTGCVKFVCVCVCVCECVCVCVFDPCIFLIKRCVNVDTCIVFTNTFVFVNQFWVNNLLTLDSICPLFIIVTLAPK